MTMVYIPVIYSTAQIYVNQKTHIKPAKNRMQVQIKKYHLRWNSHMHA